MQVMKLFLLPAVIVFFSASLTTASECRAVKWPFSKSINDIQPLSLQAIPRDHVVKYFYREISTPLNERISGLASKLLVYLKNTELNDDKYQMLLALEWAAELDSNKPRIIPITEICNLEKTIAREPSSLKKKKLK